ncbi:MAG: hypothetical protein Q4P26_03565 [Lachnospiraceae bacterium]|nr:hypothetical protein [Lachnospiraceae bacterium]
MNFLNKLERKYGRYAIQNLPMIMVVLYVAGYVIDLFFSSALSLFQLEPYDILHGQIWRLVTWVIIPPSSLDIFTIIMLYFYFSLGRTLEQTWGAFRFNLYIFSGMFFTAAGAFILYGALYAMTGSQVYGIGNFFSTYYINMSIFLAFALTYPDLQVMLYFLIPIRIKWMGLLYGILILADLVRGNWASRVAIIASLFNFIIFYLISGRLDRFSPHQVHRRQTYKKKVKQVQPRGGITKHKCAICGRTEQDGDDLEFRFCSKCDGNYEYCQDHLFTHQHIKKQ